MSRLVKRPKGQSCGECRYFADTNAGVREGVCLNEPYNVAVKDRKGLDKNFRPKWKKDWCIVWESKKADKKEMPTFGFAKEVDKTKVER